MRSASAALKPTPSAAPRQAPRVAVVVDTRAPRASDRVLRLLSQVVEAGDLHLSGSREELTCVARRLLERHYDTVFVGGGDASFSRLVTALLRQPRPAATPLPRLGLLPLGGGHRLAALVGASPLEGEGLLDDVLRARAAEVPGCRRVDLLEADGAFAAFAGAGLEAQMVHERAWFWRKLGGTPLRRLIEDADIQSPAMVLHSLSTRLPRAPAVECEVRCGAGGAFLLGPGGQRVGPLLVAGTVLFRGRARRADATCIPKGSTPAPPIRGRMHLRVEAASSGLLALARRRRSSTDAASGGGFLVSEVTLSFAQPVPVQVGGGVAGARDSLHVRVLPEAVELCDFSGGVH